MVEYVGIQWFLGILHRCQNHSAATESTVLHSGNTYFSFQVYVLLIIPHQTFLKKSTGINDICILVYGSDIHAMSQCCVAGLKQSNMYRERFF